MRQHKTSVGKITQCRIINPYFAIVFYPPPFYPFALKPIVTKAFLTVPEYMWAKNADRNFIHLHYDFQYGGWTTN